MAKHWPFASSYSRIKVSKLLTGQIAFLDVVPTGFIYDKETYSKIDANPWAILRQLSE